ncbi:restriction endonuclease subunit S [uncultured Draconibacterium sp.]|uniref:restriction endonuclease subunit S n=1 Tax=uncultured Draconibacterium sp. TaxID=1573823 RepID=UPI0029C6B31E|nr:restriction endonuclease subunit S [uncultured Draconibacterium sp.]
MGSEWRKVILKDYCTKIGSGATPRGGSSVYLDAGEISLIRSQNVYNDGFKTNGLVYITEEAAQKLNNVAVEEGDVLINITGDSVARVCLPIANILPARVNQHVAILRPEKKEFDSRYLRYFLITPFQQTLLLNLASAGATRNAITKGMLESFEVTKPPLPEQKSIAQILGSLDDKIELNRQMNQTLEQMAQALFKSWFVDFDPVIDNALAAGNEIPEPLQKRAQKRKQLDGARKPLPENIQQLFPAEFEFSEELDRWVPRGWKVKALNEFINVKHGFAFKGKFFSPEPTNDILLTPGNFKIGGGFKGDKFKYYNSEYPEDYILRKGDLIITMTDLSKAGDTLGYPAIVPDGGNKKYLHNQRLGKVEYKTDSFDTSYLYHCLCTDRYRNEILGNTSGSTVKHTSPTKILAHNIVISQTGIEKYFSKYVASLNEKVAINNLEIESLTKLRDTLLPKLVSGEVRVPEEMLT